MSEPANGRSGGIDNAGTFNTGGGDAVGRDKTTTTTTYYAPNEIYNVLQPIAEAIQAAAPGTRGDAVAKLEALKQEVAKGEKAEDRTMAKLVQGLIGLVPSAVSAVASAFGTPILSGVAGPVTQFVLEELGEGKK